MKSSPPNGAQPSRAASQDEPPPPPCPVCGDGKSRTLFEATDRLYRTTDRTFAIVECSRCRLIRLSPQPAAAELGAYYPDTYWLSPEDRAVESAQARGPILDVGCGGGLFLKMLAERGHRVLGLDSAAPRRGSPGRPTA